MSRGHENATIRWPGGARFAFTIFDDTDRMTLENGPPVYELFDELGMKFTKSVWPVAPAGPALTGGSTCADPDYLAWVLGLQASGHEIGYHNASDHPSTRDETIAALDRFEELFGHAPRIGADHAGNSEAVYVGTSRLSGPISTLYHRGMSTLRPGRRDSFGHVPGSEYFWADVLQERIDYWRSFTFTGLDAFAASPQVPYHDPERPYVNWWFTSTHADRLSTFLATVTPEALDGLEASGGVCIIYSHLAVGFASDGKVDPAFRAALEGLAGRNGWFAPASEVLDHIRSERSGDGVLSDRERGRLERHWITDQLRARGVSELRRAVRVRRS